MSKRIPFPLLRTQRRIVRVKRDAKRRHGPRHLWPPHILSRYEELKERAKAYRERYGFV